MESAVQELLASYGQNLLLLGMQVIIFMTGYGIFLGMFVILYFAFSGGRKLNKKMAACLLGIFLSFTWTIFCVGGTPLDPLLDALQAIDGAGDIITEADSAINKGILWDNMSIWSETVNIILSDLIVVWRAWVLFRGKFWKGILAIFMTANIVINIADCIYDTIQDGNQAIAVTTGTNIMDAISIAVSLATNILATVMIVVKALVHFRFLQQASSASWRQSQPLNIMLLLIECGAVFCAFQILGVISFGLNTLPGGFGFVIFVTSAEYLFNLVSALYPVAVFILIHTNNSPVDQTFYSTHSIYYADPMGGSSTVVTNYVTVGQIDTQDDEY
ncbi:hypothetical protein GYMLUDRAFT_243575 [Collybiopsis luxurians FD-317 M1]|uniref:Uncharacterized protein n=1 Tax=Collybiopsis luxurians FD-317 M1 TaxID=944289 RepID=A0A0D0CQQ8_9AGAR|nr:hypothetical protein GYMLUDRAFT_243575 [Collybiopsis luxurians FD-317 M1]